MSKFLLTSLLLCWLVQTQAGRISGIVTDDKGHPLPFASILVKGTTKGTTANNQGKYFLEMEAGDYTIIAQYVGYNRVEKKTIVGEQSVILNFELSLLQLALKEVVVRVGGEDPAYEIIRNANKKRGSYENPLDSFTCEAYIKTLIKTRKLPKKVFGQKIEEDDKKDMGVDSIGKGIIFLSESLTKVAFKKPNRTKLEVLSGRQSGSMGYGFNFPTFINFYSNNVNIIGSQLNPRGFVSPIADGAINFYKYKYLGSFWEDGKEINQIKVIARRKFEPVFSGIINITEGDWRIHSLDLMVTKEAQLELMDTLTIKQIQVPLSADIWRTKDQVITFTFKMFGIDATGSFLNVYNKYDINPAFRRKYFNNVVVQYDTAINKKSKSYWDSVRPVQLEPEEAKDYKIKDSVFAIRRDSAFSKRNIDSLRKKQGPVKLKQVFWTGFNRSDFRPKNPLTISLEPLLRSIQYNTVEGLVTRLNFSIRKNIPGWKEQVTISPKIRYGFSNTHLNASTQISFSKRSFTWDNDGGTANRRILSFEGGKRVIQFNNENPITPLVNSIYTLVGRENYMKIYESWFGEVAYSNRMDNGLQFAIKGVYEDRLPINNTTNFSFFGNKQTKLFTDNYPFEKIGTQFLRHQALVASITIEFKPGQRYIQFPFGKRAIGSKYPTLAFAYDKGISNLFGSDVDFDKWKFTVWDDINLKLAGKLRYRVGIGGFINDKSVFIQDYQHFNGNQLLFASEYLNSFQLAPYYANSTTAKFYAIGHLEHHFNGLLTNKIPFFRRLNWHLVGGANAFFVNGNNNYAEVFAGLENIFKVIRLDVVASYLNGKNGAVGLRLGLGGLLGNSIQINR
ncbi:MAG: DUF5686 and carboxypeptidase regulatory-like domain-containing protein [Chitinophagaceae bacterium]